jgi:hypothetical protein
VPAVSPVRELRRCWSLSKAAEQPVVKMAAEDLLAGEDEADFGFLVRGRCGFCGGEIVILHATGKAGSDAPANMVGAPNMAIPVTAKAKATNPNRILRQVSHSLRRSRGRNCPGMGTAAIGRCQPAPGLAAGPRPPCP